MSAEATIPSTAAPAPPSLGVKIGPLKHKGGPTKTIPLQAGSPAIDGTNPPDTDQRGVLRNDPDIGAYER